MIRIKAAYWRQWDLQKEQHDWLVHPERVIAIHFYPKSDYAPEHVILYVLGVDTPDQKDMIGNVTGLYIDDPPSIDRLTELERT